MHVVGRVRFEVPETGFEDQRPWRLRTDPFEHTATRNDGKALPISIDLTFEPKGMRSENINLLLIASRFVQPFGLFKGTITCEGTRLPINNVFGVVENHYAKW